MKRCATCQSITYVLLLSLTIFLISGCKSGNKQAANAPPLKVMTLKGTPVPVYLEMVGQAVGIPTVEIRARVAGYLQNWSFKEGSIVQKGQRLFTIEQSEYINSLNFAQADLENQTAAWEKAKLDVARLKPLLSTSAISQNDYDKAVTTELQCRAMVASSKASLATAKLNLSYTVMESPITGYIGACDVRPGNLVGKGEATLLSTVSAVDPIYVNFQMNENDYLKIMRFWEQHRDQFKDKKDVFKVNLTLSDKMAYSHPGEIDFIDRGINPQTGTIALRAVFQNPNGLVKPGNFSNVQMILYEEENGILIPQTATTQIQGKNFAFLVGAGNKVNRVPILLGRGMGSSYVVVKGLKSGDRIMLEGFQKFQEGMQITPVMIPDTLSVSKQSENN
ncbi:MAG: efflux RND transporter periplasmic adaptor subunit [Bacteroidales bacterium]|nr:efflux RND transporter periplasmic adaptor subunit [Bacteroidales bacterium]